MKSKKSNPYYGGDKIDKEDEETRKLYLTDCRRKQGALYPSFLFKSDSVQLLMQLPDSGDLLVLSGQSRLHLKARLGKSPSAEIQTHKDRKTSNNCIAKDENDFILFSSSGVIFPPFPCTIDEEARLFRSHGLPLLVWPEGMDKNYVQQYLDDYYPDCARWFRELTKVTAWLEQKWRPLVTAVGQRVNDSVDETSESAPEPIWIHSFPQDSVGAKFMRQRLSFYERYANLLQAYLIHRRQFTAAFHQHPIHRELEELYEARQASLSDDAGFFNVVGNRLLRIALEAQSKQKPVRLNVTHILRSVDDDAVRNQCLQCLLSPKALKTLLKKNNNKESEIDEPGTSDEFDSEGSSECELSDSDNVPTNIHQPEYTTESAYPNRPITKEIMDNRGLVKYRHKRQRNPRVHLRHKYRKATIRYRSRVPPVRTEVTPYMGEAKGIRVHLVKSHKFKRP